MYLHVPAEFMAYSVMPPRDLETIFSPRPKRKSEEISVSLPVLKKTKSQNLNTYTLIENQTLLETLEERSEKKVENFVFCFFPCIRKPNP
jgi:hypothetical protein